MTAVGIPYSEATAAVSGFEVFQTSNPQARGACCPGRDTAVRRKRSGEAADNSAKRKDLLRQQQKIMPPRAAERPRSGKRI